MLFFLEDDFVSDSDLHIVCMILQKQIEHIDGKKENIVVPSVKMRRMREDAERAGTSISNMRSTFRIIFFSSFLETSSRQQAAEIPNNSNVAQSTTSIACTNVDAEMKSSQAAKTETTPLDESQLKSDDTKSSETTKLPQSTTDNGNEKHEANESVPANACILCQKDEKRLACIPCGHLTTCASCGQHLRSCPICRREIEAFVRVYV